MRENVNWAAVVFEDGLGMSILTPMLRGSVCLWVFFSFCFAFFGDSVSGNRLIDCKREGKVNVWSMKGD